MPATEAKAPQTRRPDHLTCAGCGVAGIAPRIDQPEGVPVLRLAWREGKPVLVCDQCRAAS